MYPTSTKETGMTNKAQKIGTRIGLAIARDVIADDMPRKWRDLDPQDGDQLLAAGIESDSEEWRIAVEAAHTAFFDALDREDHLYSVVEAPDNGTTGQDCGMIEFSELPMRIRLAIIADPIADEWVLPALADGNSGEELDDLSIIVSREHFYQEHNDEL